MNNETHLSAEQKEKTNNLRIPQAHEDKRRPQNHQSQKKIGQSSVDDRLRLPKSARLLSRDQFRSLQRSGCQWAGSLIFVQYREGRSSMPKLGLTVSRKYGKAHMRNRFKRVVREAFRQLLPSLPIGIELNILPRTPHSNPPTSAAILIELEKLLCVLH